MTNESINNLEQKILAASQLMRSVGLSTLDYTEHLIYFLFLKWLDTQEQEQEIKNPSYRTRLGDSRWRFGRWIKRQNDLSSFIGQELFPHLASIQDYPNFDNSDIRAIFSNVYLLLRDPAALHDVLALVRDIDIETFEQLGDVYSLLLSRMATEAGQGVEHLTSHQLIRLMVELSDPQPGQRIYDPACGTGSLLVGALRHIRERDDIISFNKSIYGQEISSRIHHLAIINIILHGGNAQNIHCENALSTQAKPSEQYDLILCHVPSGPLVRSSQSVELLPVRTNNLESLFLQHVMLNLKDGGRAVLLVPESLLFLEHAEQEIRKWLISDFVVEGVISLPPGAIPPYNSGKSNILVFRKSAIRKSRRVWFFEVRPDENGSPLLENVYSSWHSKQSGSQTWFADLDTIANTEYVLSVNRYRPSQAQKGQFLWVPLGDLLARARRVVELNDDKIYCRITVRQRGGGIEERDKVYGHQIQTKRGQQQVRTQDVIVARIDAKMGAFAVVSSRFNGAIVSPSYFLYELRPAAPVIADYLALLFEYPFLTNEIQSYVRGSTNQASIQAEDFLKLSIPLPPIEEQQRMAKQIYEIANEIEIAQGRAASIREEFGKQLFEFVARSK